MRKRIYKSLLAMGLVSVVLTFILSMVLYYQGMQDEFSHELGALTETVSGAVAKDREEDSLSYLKWIYRKNDARVHVVWLDTDGSVLYDSETGNDENYAAGAEVQKAFAEGRGTEVHRDSRDKPKSYYAVRADDGTVVRLSRSRSVAFTGYSTYLPEIVVFFLVFAVGCLAAAERETDKILKPFHFLGDLVEQIMEGKKVEKVPSEYEELKPLISKVEEQHDEIQSYTDELEEEKNTVRIMLDTISDGIILLNSNKEILDYNRATENIFHPGKDKRFRRIASLYHDEDWLRVIGKAYRTDGRQEYSMTLFAKPFRLVMNKLELSDGETGLLIALRDMTSAHAAEKMRREFSANVSHELKTPLTSISGFAEMIANGMYQKPEDVRLFGSRIMEESQRMMSLIDTIMHLSKIEETETTITWKTVAMDSLVRYAADLMRPQAEKKHIDLAVETEPLYTYGNAALLSELIMNLLDNAVKYNHDGGSVQVKLFHDGDEHLVLTVSDTGIGIPKDKQDRVFERFYRAEESRNKETGGSGLGLAICKHIVEKHKGTLTVHSVEGEGTTMTVVLPKLTDAQVAAEHVEALTAQQEAADAESGKLAAEEAEQDRQEELEEKESGGKPVRHKTKKGKKKGKKKIEKAPHPKEEGKKKPEKDSKKK